MLDRMGRLVRRAPARVAGSVAVVVLMIGLMAGPATATDPLFQLDFPQGVACAGFALHVDGYGPAGAKQPYREFSDRDGNVVRTLTTGTGFTLTFSNPLTGDSLSLPSNGAVNSTRFASDGSQTATMMGHTIVIMFPTDAPPGPSTTLYTGRVVLTTDVHFVSTLVSARGRTLDICTALGG
jgi:hypothetical protein